MNCWLTKMNMMPCLSKSHSFLSNCSTSQRVSTTRVYKYNHALFVISSFLLPSQSSNTLEVQRPIKLWSRLEKICKQNKNLTRNHGRIIREPQWTWVSLSTSWHSDKEDIHHLCMYHTWSHVNLFQLLSPTAIKSCKNYGQGFLFTRKGRNLGYRKVLSFLNFYGISIWSEEHHRFHPGMYICKNQIFHPKKQETSKRLNNLFCVCLSKTYCIPSEYTFREPPLFNRTVFKLGISKIF